MDKDTQLLSGAIKRAELTYLSAEEQAAVVRMVGELRGRGFAAADRLMDASAKLLQWVETHSEDGEITTAPCPHCGHTTYAGDNFCEACATKLNEECPRCWRMDGKTHNCGQANCPGWAYANGRLVGAAALSGGTSLKVHGQRPGEGGIHMGTYGR